jgi:hypothetical protein
MTATDRALVAAIRTELATIEPARPCDRRAELAGLAGLGRLGARDVALARLVVRLRRGSGSIGGAMSEEEWRVAPDHCRTAWLRGRFLGAGSLSVANGRTHLEFVLSPTEGHVLANRLTDLGLAAGYRERRGRGVVVWKSAETVGRFLRLAGVTAALLELEARSVSRSLRGELNRVLNAESANLARSVDAAGRQLAAIADLEASGSLGDQPPSARIVARARTEAPDASLSELARLTGLHRSAVQRALDRIVQAAERSSGAALTS